MKIPSLFNEVGLSGLLDIVFMTFLIYFALVWFKRTRAVFVVVGMFIVGLAYFITRLFDLPLTRTVFQGFFAIILVAVVVIFQEEIKYFFEQIASRSFLRNIRGKVRIRLPQKEVEVLVRTLSAFARERIGALIVVHGKDPIIRHLDGGIELNGEMSEPLLRSIFDPHSDGHDGAVIVRGNIISQFACHLPLSKDLSKTQRTGTRHAAALGLSELTDALCIVVSEERGTISLAHGGTLRETVDSEDLSRKIEAFYREISPHAEKKPWWDFITKNYREKAIALVITCALWFFVVHESRIEYHTYPVAVGYSNLPSGFAVTSVLPAQVEVTLSGPKRSFYFVDANDLQISLSLFNAKSGEIEKPISLSHITVPNALSIETVEPGGVRITITDAGK
ncbi:MAG: diadenylate cyclase [Chitinispirillaceae bacterium]|nr:diadenylate cyclase [Chitinispirillaceae bacterium]